MNKIINKLLLTGDKFMSQLLLKQPEFTYSACGPFPKHRERIQKFNETGNLKHLYRNKLDKACFTHDADSKDLVKSTISDKILKNRAYEIARNRWCDGYQRALTSMVCQVFDRKTGSGEIATSKVGVSVNEQLAGELHKPNLKKNSKRKILCEI